jgi:hypothetical protein
MTSVQIFGNLAFLMIACSFMVKDILWLRVLSITGSIFSIIYNCNVSNSILWEPIRGNLFLMSLNIYHIAKIIYGNRQLVLNSKEEELYQLSFSGLNKIEFAKLVRAGSWMTAKSGESIVHQGELLDHLMMIFNGTVDIEVNGKKVNQLKDGQFIGEMSYLTNKPASANVKANFDTEYISWKHEELKELMKRNPSLIFSLQSAMGLQLSNVLVAKNEGN